MRVCGLCFLFVIQTRTIHLRTGPEVFLPSFATSDIGMKHSELLRSSLPECLVYPYLTAYTPRLTYSFIWSHEGTNYSLLIVLPSRSFQSHGDRQTLAMKRDGSRIADWSHVYCHAKLHSTNVDCPLLFKFECIQDKEKLLFIGDTTSHVSKMSRGPRTTFVQTYRGIRVGEPKLSLPFLFNRTRN